MSGVPIELVGVSRAHEIAAHRAAFGAQGAVGHLRRSS